MPAQAAASVTRQIRPGAAANAIAQAAADTWLRSDDEPAGQPLVGQRLADHPRLPVVQPALRVEQVGDHPGARGRARGHLRGGGVAVARR